MLPSAAFSRLVAEARAATRTRFLARRSSSHPEAPASRHGSTHCLGPGGRLAHWRLSCRRLRHARDRCRRCPAKVPPRRRAKHPPRRVDVDRRRVERRASAVSRRRAQAVSLSRSHSRSPKATHQASALRDGQDQRTTPVDSSASQRHTDPPRSRSCAVAARVGPSHRDQSENPGHRPSAVCKQVAPQSPGPAFGNVPEELL
jgi:hypothetical protein